LLQVKNISKAVAEAIAKLRAVATTDYESIKNTKPAPTEGDKDAIEYYEKVTHKAQEPSVISMMLQNKQQGIEAIFDCLFQNNLLDEILRTSVNVFKEVPAGELMNPDSEYALDLHTALEYFIAIFEMNTGGFSELGKFSRLLETFREAAKKAGPAVKS
jgi:hypothetical protein